MTWALTTFQQWLLFTGTVLVLGCVAWRIHIAPRAARTLPADAGQALRDIERRVVLLGLAAALTLIVAWILRMVVQVMGFRDPFVPLWEDVSFLLFQVTWGTVWMVQGVVLVLLFLALIVARSQGRRAKDGASADDLLTGRMGWSAATFLALGLVATLAMSSHAMGIDSWRSFVLAADGLHLLAAGTWIGSLAVILAVGRGSRDSSAAPAVFAAQIRSFSPLALVSGLSLVAMGVVLSWTHLLAVSDLWTSTYGRLISAKVALALLILGLGALNWRKGIPKTDTPEGAAAIRRRAAWEVMLATVVLMVTAILVHSAKP